MQIKLVEHFSELEKIASLNQANLKINQSEQHIREEGFVSWSYPVPLLEAIHAFAPSVIAMDDNTLAGYALTAVHAARSVHPELSLLMDMLAPLEYEGRPLFDYRFYMMGQICVAKPYRGQGIPDAMYQYHRDAYAKDHDFLLTTISTQNVRSLQTHERIGFKVSHTVNDRFGDWVVVVWDWRS